MRADFSAMLGAGTLLSIGFGLGVGLFAPPESALRQAFVSAVLVTAFDVVVVLRRARRDELIAGEKAARWPLLLHVYFYDLGLIITVAQGVKWIVF